MEKQEMRRTSYRLTARMKGDCLRLDPEVREELRRAFYARIRALRRRRPDSDRTAFDESVEWERLGDFLFSTDALTGAIRAYREAVVCCLCGVYYDYGRYGLPCTFLRRRYLALLEKGLDRCGGNPKLKALLLEERIIRSEYALIRAETR